jgi:hypothetical protein
MYKIGILIPTTTAKRDWKNYKETTLFQVFLNSFVQTYCNQYTYIIYLIVDDDDKIFGHNSTQNEIKSIMHKFKNISVKFISSKNITKGWVTKMWNRIFQLAYDENCDYFFQCGDDILLQSKKWVTNSINELKKHNNIGLSGPLDIGRIQLGGPNCEPGGSRFIQTQAFVSRKHMELFGYFFPEEIKNWYCDDWITKVYYPKYFYKINNTLMNIGGPPRYDVVEQCPWEELIKRDKQKLPK